MLFTFPTPGLLLPVLATLMVELLVAALVFYLWPLEDGFADPQVQGPLGLARRLALRHNYFPSLHVALAFTGAATMGARWGRGPSLVLYVWASLIALSTLTTHQHHLIDVVGGFCWLWQPIARSTCAWPDELTLARAALVAATL